mgnify:CR=1 FL=1
MQLKMEEIYQDLVKDAEIQQKQKEYEQRKPNKRFHRFIQC